VNENIHELFNYTHDYQLDYVQLHGTESPEYCREIRSLWGSSTVRSAQLVKAFSVDEDFDFDETEAYEEHCSFFIFDTKGPGYGGTGQQFDWELLQAYQGSTPFLLSGGIHADSAEAIKAIDHPMLMGVDINSKFETEPAMKDIDLIQNFIQQIKAF
ncbi:MAG: phosphoribosylanthranilate isomerase, partial [Bacteroidota bacterium]